MKDEVDKIIERYAKERDAALETRDPLEFRKFLEKNRKIIGEDVYVAFMQKDNEFVMLTMAKMSFDCYRLSRETKEHYKAWLAKYRERRKE